jgi:hypothetical protein
MFRSGSTLTEQVLAGHSRVTAGGEIDFLPALVRNELSPFPARMGELSPRQLDELAARYTASLSKPFSRRAARHRQAAGQFPPYRPHQEPVPGREDHPHDARCAGQRLSIYFLHLDHGMAYAPDLMDIAHYYRQYGADGALEIAVRRRHPRPITTPSCERRDPPSRRLLAFCDLDWEEWTAPISSTCATRSETASVWQVREALHQRSSAAGATMRGICTRSARISATSATMRRRRVKAFGHESYERRSAAPRQSPPPREAARSDA